MFRKLTLLLILLLALGLVACGGDEEEPAEEPAVEEPAEEAAEEPAEEPAAEEEAEAPAESVTLTIESWRNDDLAIWEDVLIPAFNEEYPDIEVVFAPTAPADGNPTAQCRGIGQGIDTSSYRPPGRGRTRKRTAAGGPYRQRRTAYHRSGPQ